MLKICLVFLKGFFLGVAFEHCFLTCLGFLLFDVLYLVIFYQLTICLRLQETSSPLAEHFFFGWCGYANPKS